MYLCYPYFIAGYYYYIETSLPQQAGQSAYLRTQAQYLADGRPKCLSLWYNAYGQGKGTLRVSMGSDPNGFTKSTLAEIPSKYN